MAIAYVQSKSNRQSSTSVAVTLDNSVQAGSLLVAAVTGTFLNSDTMTVSDGNGNTWTRVRQQTIPNGIFPANPARHELWYAENANAGSTTVTLANTGGSTHSIVVQEFTGVVTSGALDKQNSNSAGSGTAMTAGSTGTLAQASELVIGSGALGTSGSVTAGSGYSDLVQTAAGAAAAIQSKVVSATTAQNPDMTASTSQAWAMIVATFKAKLDPLVVNGAEHDLTSDNVVLSPNYDLVLQEASHDLTSDNLDLIQSWLLVVQNTTHAHLAQGDFPLLAPTMLEISQAIHSLVDTGEVKLFNWARYSRFFGNYGRVLGEGGELEEVEEVQLDYYLPTRARLGELALALTPLITEDGIDFLISEDGIILAAERYFPLKGSYLPIKPTTGEFI